MMPGVTTDGTGSAFNLTPGTYNLSVAAKGFQNSVQQGLGFDLPFM
jgi:hypothetical protein